MRKTPSQASISREEQKRIMDEATAALELLEDDRFQFFRDYLNNQLQYIQNSILNNTVRDVREVVPITEKLTRIFFTPKKVQVDELVGQYKLINQLLDNLKQLVSLQEELSDQLANQRVVVNE
jgi:hypothetical protein